MFTEEKDFNKRVRQAITISWDILQQKIASGFLEINKEASLQLQFANILQSFMPMILFDEKEKVSLMLEKTLTLDNGKHFECDVFITANDGENDDHRIAIEMKCYRTLAGSGRRRGASNIFRKDVYVDIELLENYKNSKKCDETVFLAMTDYPTMFNANDIFDISNHTIETATYKHSIGGREFCIQINGTYKISWKEKKGFYFLEI